MINVLLKIKKTGKEHWFSQCSFARKPVAGKTIWWNLPWYNYKVELEIIEFNFSPDTPEFVEHLQWRYPENFKDKSFRDTIGLKMKKDLELIKTVDVKVNQGDYKDLDKLLIDNGLVNMRKTPYQNRMHVDYDADSLIPSWEELEDAVLDKYPDASIDFDYGESDDDEDPEYKWHYEKLYIQV